MPDHVMELITAVDSKRPVSTLIVEEHSDRFASLGDAVEAEKRRVDNAWSSQHDFMLVSERAFSTKMGPGTIVTFAWRRARGEPLWLHSRALFLVNGVWLRGIAETIAQTPADGGNADATSALVGVESPAIDAMFASLSCARK